VGSPPSDGQPGWALRSTADDPATGMTHADVLKEFRYVTEKDIRACLAYGADRERKLEILNA